jgi:hypothetical protein
MIRRIPGVIGFNSVTASGGVRLHFVGSDRAIPRSPVGGKPTSERPSQPPSSKTLGSDQ